MWRPSQMDSPESSECSVIVSCRLSVVYTLPYSPSPPALLHKLKITYPQVTPNLHKLVMRWERQIEGQLEPCLENHPHHLGGNER